MSTTTVLVAALNISKLSINILLLSSSSSSTSSFSSFSSIDAAVAAVAAAVAASASAYQFQLCRETTRWGSPIGSPITPATPTPELLLLLYLISFDLIQRKKLKKSGGEKVYDVVLCMNWWFMVTATTGSLPLLLPLRVLNSPVSDNRFPTPPLFVLGISYQHSDYWIMSQHFSIYLHFGHTITPKSLYRELILITNTFFKSYSKCFQILSGQLASFRSESSINISIL